MKSIEDASLTCLFNRTPVVSAFIVQNDNSHSVLVAKRRTPPEVGRYSIPGGRVELGENAKHAVQREVFEETRLNIPLDAFYPYALISQIFAHSQRSYLAAIYVVFWNKTMGIPSNPEPEKHTPWQWEKLETLVGVYDPSSTSLMLHALIDMFLNNAKRVSSSRKWIDDRIVYR